MFRHKLKFLSLTIFLKNDKHDISLITYVELFARVYLMIPPIDHAQ